MPRKPPSSQAASSGHPDDHRSGTLPADDAADSAAASQAAPPGPPEPTDDADSKQHSQQSWGQWWRDVLSPRELTSFAVSCGFHAALIVILSLVVAIVPVRQGTTLIVSPRPSDGLLAEDLDESRITIEDSLAHDTSSALNPLDVPSSLPMSLDQMLQDDQPATSLAPTGAAQREAMLRSAGRQLVEVFRDAAER